MYMTPITLCVLDLLLVNTIVVALPQSSWDARCNSTMAGNIAWHTARRQYIQLAVRTHCWSELWFAIVPCGEHLDLFFCNSCC